MKNIYDCSIKQLENYFVNINEKKYKAIQIFEWLYQKKVSTFDEISNIKKDIIEQLNKDFTISKLEIITKQSDKDVKKYLFKLADGNKIEAVLMNHNYGMSLCISSQVGCNMGCVFCESGRLKKIRNLEAFEMVLQILQIEEDINQRISHLVIMGIGEPFDNYDNVMNFIDIINHPKGLALGSRHITISTCGLVPQIEKFMNNEKQINLAISIHAPNDEIRNKLLPINKVYNLSVLMSTLKKYISKTKRRVTFEYILLNNINDNQACALELSQLLKGMNCYVNLIPYNETSDLKYKRSSDKKIMEFYNILKQNKINVTIRKEFGSKVNAACGQLRANYEED